MQHACAQWHWAFLLLTSSGGLQASEPPADDLFSKGVESFNKGDYEAAVRFPERARKAGRDPSGLIYNLSVAHFRSGNLDAFRGYFRELLGTPEEAAFAHYNLGLIALERNNPRAAIRQLESTVELNAPSRIRRLAREQLSRIDEPRPFADLAVGSGNLLVALAGGYEDNLNLASDNNLEESAPLQAGFAWISQRFARVGSFEVRATGLANIREYNGVSQADQQLARPGLRMTTSGEGI